MPFILCQYVSVFPVDAIHLTNSQSEVVAGLEIYAIQCRKKQTHHAENHIIIFFLHHGTAQHTAAAQQGGIGRGCGGKPSR